MKFFYKNVASTIITTSLSLGGVLIAVEAYAEGLVTTQGDAAMRADIARDRFDVNGSGVTVGVISNSYDLLDGAEADIESGDLPRNARAIEEAPLPSCPPGFESDCDEGRAIMQIVHDVAPGANLIFHAAPLNPREPNYTQNYSTAITRLANAGARIIISDVGNPTAESFFQEGIIEQTIDTLANAPGRDSVAYFAAAGNNRRNSYQSQFRGSGVIDSASNGEFHDFNPGSEVDYLQRINIPSGDGGILYFQWDSPFPSISGSEANGDVDLVLLDESGENVLATSSKTREDSSDPLEELFFTNETSTTEFNLAILNKGDSDLGTLKYIYQAGPEFSIEEYDTNSSTIFGNANAEGAAAVGAAFYGTTPEFDGDPAEIQDFSSVGGTPILLDIEGNRLPEPEILTKPAFVAPDGGNTTFFVRDEDIEGDGFPNFRGTSASVAHAGAVAALMLEENPDLTTAEIYSILERTALDMDDPSTPGFDVGFDFATGYGLIQADRALARVNAIPEPSTISGSLAFLVFGVVYLVRRKSNKLN